MGIAGVCCNGYMMYYGYKHKRSHLGSDFECVCVQSGVMRLFDSVWVRERERFWGYGDVAWFWMGVVEGDLEVCCGF